MNYEQHNPVVGIKNDVKKQNFYNFYRLRFSIPNNTFVKFRLCLYEKEEKPKIIWHIIIDGIIWQPTAHYTSDGLLDLGVQKILYINISLWPPSQG